MMAIKKCLYGGHFIPSSVLTSEVIYSDYSEKNECKILWVHGTHCCFTEITQQPGAHFFLKTIFTNIRYTIIMIRLSYL